MSSDGTQANDSSYGPGISADGRYVVFPSDASNLVPGDTSHRRDVFVRDRQTGTTARVSVSGTGIEANGASGYPSISADGRYVAFQSYASNLVSGDTNGFMDVFVRDRQLGTTERVSVRSDGTQGDAGSATHLSISADGRYVAFMSPATDLVSGDTNESVDDIYVAQITPEGSFADISSSPYKTAIEDLASRGVINGYPDRTFRPNNPVSRQQFAKMIVKTLGLDVSEQDVCPFPDVPGGVDPSDPLYARNYVAVCAAQGITQGKTATRFAPYDSITRQQLITMVTRAAGLPDPPADYAPAFTSGQFSLEEHYLSACKADSAGLLAGLQGLGPAYDFMAPASRGECAQLLHNLIATGMPSPSPSPSSPKD